VFDIKCDIGRNENMAYDFEKIGKQSVLNDLIKSIKGKSDYLQANNLRKVDKLKTLKELGEMSKDAYKILDEL